MKNMLKIFSCALIIVLVLSMSTAIAFAETQSQMPNIISSEYITREIRYTISGLNGFYIVSGNYVGYGYANEKYDVEAAQAGLEKVNSWHEEANCDPQGVDGLFGSNTYYAVQHFQVYAKISCDGIVGPDTWRKLEAYSNNY